MTEETAPAAAKPTFKVRNYLDECDLAADSSYSTTNIDDAFQQQAGLMARYTVIAAQCSKQVNDLKLLIEAGESRVYRRLRDTMLAEAKAELEENPKAKIEKPTDALLKMFVAGDDRIIAMKRALNEAKQIEAIAKGAVLAMEARRDMLIQAGANGRKEMDGELRMRMGEARGAAMHAAGARIMERRKELAGEQE